MRVYRSVRVCESLRVYVRLSFLSVCTCVVYVGVSVSM